MQKDTNTKDLKDSLRYFPDKPGVYLMKDGKDRILYVGKASNLRNRVRSYFNSDKDIKTTVLMKKVEKIDYIVTGGEYEALLLENSLIKQWLPRYNINLKDGKTYPLIRITGEAFPRIFRTRRIVQDGSTYHGPFTNVGGIDTYLDLIDRLFPLRKCKGKLKTRSHPCLYYHIGRCSAPCAGKISAEEYAENVEKIRDLLAGNTGKLIAGLHEKMQRAGEELRYEKAAEYRDAIAALRQINEDQRVIDFNTDIRDYIAASSGKGRCVIVVFQMRSGKLLGSEWYGSPAVENKETAMMQFLLQYYDGGRTLPEHLFLSVPVETAALRKYFLETYGKSPEIGLARGKRNTAVMNMTVENSKAILEKQIRERGNLPALEELKAVLELPKVPRRIEGFDISHLSGSHPVASMVSFLNGVPDKSRYRKFHIKKAAAAHDDYEAMREVVARRYTRVLNEQEEGPDLILIDGGKGQVSAARSILEALGFGSIPLLGLAKKNEEIFLPQRDKPVLLPEGSPPLRVLQAVRDEAHRFATAFNKDLRKKDGGLSLLQSVPGIGPAKSKKILQIFGSLQKAAAVSREELQAKTGISKKAAGELYTRLKNAST